MKKPSEQSGYGFTVWGKRLLRSGNTYSLMGNISIAALGFLNFSLLARGLSPDRFGVWVVYATVAALLEMVRAGLVNPALLRFVPGNPKGDPHFLAAGWWLAVAFTLLAASLLPVITFIFPFDGETLQLYRFWLPLSLLVNLPFYFAFWRLQMERQFLRLWWLRLVYIGGFSVVALVQLLQPMELPEIAQWQVFTHFTGTAMAVLVGWCPLFSLFHWDGGAFKKFWQMGRFTSITALSSHLLRSMDVYLLGWLLGSSAAGLYGVPQKLTEVLAIPLRSFVANAHPQLAEAVNLGQWARAKLIFTRYVGWLTGLYLLGALAVALLAKLLVLLMGGNAYLSGIPILQALMLYQFLLPFDRFAGLLLDLLGKPQWNFAKTVGMVLLNGLADWWAIRMGWGATGVALMSSLVFVAGATGGFLLLRKQLLRNNIS